VLSLAWAQLEGTSTAARHQTWRQRKMQAAVAKGRICGLWQRRMRTGLEVTRLLGVRAREIPPGQEAVKTMDPRVNTE
jgi:hypothetical protein